MRVTDVMTSPVVAVTPAATAGEANRVMTDRRLTTLPVVDADGRLLGLLSEVELVRAGYLQGQDGEPGYGAADADRGAVLEHHRTAGALMRAPGFGVGPDAELTEVAAMMVERRVRSLPVLEGGRVVGMVTWQDLLRALAPPN